MSRRLLDPNDGPDVPDDEPVSGVRPVAPKAAPVGSGWHAHPLLVKRPPSTPNSRREAARVDEHKERKQSRTAIAADRVCACGRVHWRPDLRTECVSCELTRRKNAKP